MNDGTPPPVPFSGGSLRDASRLCKSAPPAHGGISSELHHLLGRITSTSSLTASHEARALPIAVDATPCAVIPLSPVEGGPMLALLALWGCGTEGCLGGEEGCRVEPPCAALTFTCDGREARWSRVDAVLAANNYGAASPGDWVLDNGTVRVTISDLDHPHYIAPTGGNLIDIQTYAPDGTLRADDALRNIYQVGGLLPTEAVAYTHIEGFMDGPNAVIQVRGTYDDDPEVEVYTRYELAPCDPGVRIRTELVNRNDDPESVFLADVLYIGGRGLLAFAPGEDLGMNHPPFGLTTLADGLRDVPWLGAGAQEGEGTALAFTSCSDDTVTALMAQELSAVGLPPTLLPYGDYLIHERFVSVGHGGSVAAAADVALEVRRHLHGEPWVDVALTVDDGGVGGGRPHAVVVEGDVPLGADPVTPVTHLELDGDQRFRVPAGGTYTVLVERFGLPWARTTFTAEEDAEVTVVLPPPARVALDVTIDGEEDHALVVVHPADEATLQAVEARYLGRFIACAPLLGHPYGAAPSCNRILVSGPTTVALPPGTYDFYSAAGPFSSLAVARGVELQAGGPPTPVTLEVQTLPLLGPGMLTADFHVHGSASFDSSIPDGDRVRAFLSSRLDVIAATDHDQVHDYREAMEALGAHERMELLVGLETTGHILQPLLRSSNNPKVVGHWIVWPMPYDPTGPWRGAPWDEKALPGELFTRFEDAGWPAETGVIQLNHPWGGAQFGRDFGWMTALEMDLTQPLVGPSVPEGHALFGATPPGARFANDAYHVQEVMNGTDNASFERYRAVWHYLLNQGVVRGATANSDSHTLGGNVLGFPQNIVFTRERVGDFDTAAFNAAVRAGRIVGTNGPLLNAWIDDGGTTHSFGVDRALTPSGVLRVEVAAASWIDVEELRVYVNGALAHAESIAMEEDPGRPGVRVAAVSLPLGDLLPDGRDSWLTVEVGRPLPPVADLDCDGVPDTGDNDGDGTVDWRDVEAYAGLTDPPASEREGCLDDVGPLRPDRELQLPRDDYDAFVPGGAPLAFTNPFLFDGDGDGAYTGVAR